MKRQTILVIGAGSTGLSSALHLATRSNHRVIVVDRSLAGSAQTGHCCGFVRTFYNAREMAFSASQSMEEIKKICHQRNGLEYVRKGLLVIDRVEHRELMKKNVGMLRSLGVRAEYLKGSEISNVHPYAETQGVCAGFDKEAGYVNPKLTVDYLKDQCIHAGVQIREYTKVMSLKKKNGKFYAKTKKDELVADKVLNATAASTNRLNKMLGFELPVRVIKTNNCFYRLPLGPQQCLVAIADFVHQFYIIPHKEFVDVSSIALDLKQTADPEKMDKLQLDIQVDDQYLALIAKRVRSAERSIKMGGFASCIDVTPDYYPILSHIDGIGNYYCATGFSGTGFKHFPVFGKLLAEMILDMPPTYPVLLPFFRHDRFNKEVRRTDVRDSYFIVET